MNIIALGTDVVARWRSAAVDDYGNRLTPILADCPAAFPCRHCLRDAEPGEALLLASHSPFALAGPYREVGPLFVHAQPCARFSGGDVPLQLRRRLLALRGYDRAQALVDGVVVEGAAIEDALASLFARAEVDWVHVRFARPGCFACRIERG
ncbi:MAG TPA: DUF1203 domain-containing protein [Polyangia bacterium]